MPIDGGQSVENIGIPFLPQRWLWRLQVEHAMGISPPNQAKHDKQHPRRLLYSQTDDCIGGIYMQR